MPPTWSTRIKSTLRRPPRVNVRTYLDAQRAGQVAVEDEFFWQLQLASGVFKATNRNRFDDTFEALRRAIPRDQTSLRILDVACSSGISTVELHRAMLRPGLTVETYGTDIVTRVMHATVDGGAALIYDLDGNVLGAEVDAMIINRRPSRAVRLHHPWRVHRARRLVAQYQPGPGVAFRPPPGSTVTEVSLVSSAVARTPGVRIEEEDLLRPQVPGTFDLIRAANILNRGYFTDAQLRACVDALLRRLVVGGRFFVVRTERKVNHGTLWTKRPDGVEIVDTVGHGCEIGDLVADVARTASQRTGERA